MTDSVNRRNEATGGKVIENEVADKPSNVERTSGSVVWLRLSNVFKLAGLILLLGCLYQSFTDFSTTMERRFQEILLTQENSEKNITNLANTIIKLNGQLTSLSKEKQRLEVKLEKAEKHISTLQNENIDLNGKFTSLSEETRLMQERLGMNITTVEKNNIELNEILKDLWDGDIEQQLKLEKAENKLTTLEKDNIELHAKLSSLSEENHNFLLKQENLETKMTTLEKDNIGLHENLSSLSEEKQLMQENLERTNTKYEKNNIELNEKMTALWDDIIKLQLKLEKAEKKITSLGKDNYEFNTTLVTVSEETSGGLSKTNMFLKEFYKKFTLKNTLMDKHDTAIQHMYNFSNNFNEKLMTVKNEQTQMLISINQRLDARQGCQSGYDVGGDSHSEHAFPSARTVQFNPPFKSIPALSYGTTMIDTTSHVKLRLELLSLTAESFTVHFHTWGKYALYAAKFSWMACPK